MNISPLLVSIANATSARDTFCPGAVLRSARTFWESLLGADMVIGRTEREPGVKRCGCKWNNQPKPTDWSRWRNGRFETNEVGATNRTTQSASRRDLTHHRTPPSLLRSGLAGGTPPNPHDTHTQHPISPQHTLHEHSTLYLDGNVRLVACCDTGIRRMPVLFTVL